MSPPDELCRNDAGPTDRREAEASRRPGIYAGGVRHDRAQADRRTADGSLGMLSDAAHSGLDLLGTALTFFSVPHLGQARR